jgi:hypothetical protein
MGCCTTRWSTCISLRPPPSPENPEGLEGLEGKPKAPEKVFGIRYPKKVSDTCIAYVAECAKKKIYIWNRLASVCLPILSKRSKTPAMDTDTATATATATSLFPMDDLEEVYQNWEEAERMHADRNRVYDTMDTLRPSDVTELAYQTRRLKYSPAYFSGHVACCGDIQNGALAWVIGRHSGGK